MLFFLLKENHFSEAFPQTTDDAYKLFQIKYAKFDEDLSKFNCKTFAQKQLKKKKYTIFMMNEKTSENYYIL